MSGLNQPKGVPATKSVIGKEELEEYSTDTPLYAVKRNGCPTVDRSAHRLDYLLNETLELAKCAGTQYDAKASGDIARMIKLIAGQEKAAKPFNNYFLTRGNLEATDIPFTDGVPSVDGVFILDRMYRLKNEDDADFPAIEITSADGSVWVLASTPFRATDAADVTDQASLNGIAQAAHELDVPLDWNVPVSAEVCFDPTASAFALPDDAAFLTAQLHPNFVTPAILTEYQDYREVFNSYEKSIKWASRIEYNGGNGLVWMALEAGKHNMFGHSFINYESSNVYLRGKVARFLNFTNVTFTPSNDFPYAYDAVLDYTGNSTGIEVGMGATILHSEGANPALDASAEVLNGAFEILDITPTQITIRVYDARNIDDGTFNLNPNLGVTTPLSGMTAFRITVHLSQHVIWGGYNGKNPEGFLNFEYGTKLTINNIHFIVPAPPENNPLFGTSSERDRKILFFRSAKFHCLGFAGANGGTGSVIRTFGTSNVLAAGLSMGGTVKNYVGKIGYRLQQNGTFECARCSSGGFTQNVLQVNGGGSGSYHVGVIANCGADRLSSAEVTAAINNLNEADDIPLGSGVIILNKGSASLNSARIMYCARAILNQGYGEVTIGTHIRNCDHGLTWRDGDGKGTPTFINNDDDFENAAVGFNQQIFGGHWNSAAGQTP